MLSCCVTSPAARGPSRSRAGEPRFPRTGVGGRWTTGKTGFAVAYSEPPLPRFTVNNLDWLGAPARRHLADAIGRGALLGLCKEGAELMVDRVFLSAIPNDVVERVA